MADFTKTERNLQRIFVLHHPTLAYKPMSYSSSIEEEMKKFYNSLSEKDKKGIKKGLLGFWIIIPPLWLWFEFCFLFKDGKAPFSNDFEKFKYGQELTKNLWLSISALLLLVYCGKVPGL